MMACLGAQKMIVEAAWFFAPEGSININSGLWQALLAYAGKYFLGRWRLSGFF